jgi:hypothetical protein
MTFVTRAGAVRYLARHPGIRLAGDQGDGWSLFELAR